MRGNYCSQILVVVLRGEVLKIVKVLLDFSSTFATANIKFSENLKYDLNFENSSCFFLVPAFSLLCEGERKMLHRQ